MERRAALYLRVSTSNGQTTANQRRELMAAANRTATDDEIAQQLKSVQADAQNRLNSIPQPNPLEIPLAGFGAGIDAYSRFFPQNTQ